MSPKEKVAFSWSGGKDSALALDELRREGRYDVAALLTTVSEAYDRICMHGVRRDLLDRQADALGIPCRKILMSQDATNAEYEAKMAAVFGELKADGVAKVVFGDIFLEDLKAYRDRQL